RIAEERSAADHLLALRSGGEGGVAGCVRTIPVVAPLPHVAAHVGEAARRLPEGPDRRRGAPAVRDGVLGREVTLPRVGAIATVLDERVAPGVVITGPMADPRGVLPLDLGREPLALPSAVRE